MNFTRISIVYTEQYFIKKTCLMLNYFSIQILLTMIWLRKYPTMEILSFVFGIPVTCTHRIIHKCVKILHAYLVPKYIQWHTMPEWRSLAGTYPEWPRVVAILDGTPFRISKPKGLIFVVSFPLQKCIHLSDVFIDVCVFFKIYRITVGKLQFYLTNANYGHKKHSLRFNMETKNTHMSTYQIFH